MNRQQTAQIIKDLNKKIVFLVGPRQVGKTWLAKNIATSFNNIVYLNYDKEEDKEVIKKHQWLDDTDLLILDELHKMKGWKNYLKGVFDTRNDRLKILVTGSARLDTFRQAGDSLAGRFFIHHLLPLSLAELVQVGNHSDIYKLMKRGGFPEPFLADSDEEADRWRNQYIDGLIRDDVLNFEKIDDLNAMKTVFWILRHSVGSSISVSSIANQVQKSPTTIKRYIDILEALYIIFRITPYSKKVSRSILKESKIYFYDTGLVIGSDGIKLENLVATSLLKSIMGRNDYLGKRESLHYIRTKEQQEVDFAIEDSEKGVVEIIEVKLSDDSVSKNLKYFSEKYSWPAVQLIANLSVEKQIDKIKMVKANNYLEKLFI